jgi:chromosome segregation ATPase
LLQATYLRFVDAADRSRTLTEQLNDARLHRAQLEAALQEAKLERSRAIREKEEAALATLEVADAAEGLKLELEQHKKEIEDKQSVIAALEAEGKEREDEITRLQTFVHKTQVMALEAETLRVKVSPFCSSTWLLVLRFRDSTWNSSFCKFHEPRADAT